MVRHRTRACAECRRRRIRCDETVPQCHQCRRAGRSCTGATQELLIVDMTPGTSSHSGFIHKPRTSSKLKASTAQQRYPLIKAPATGNAMTELVVAQFITSFCGTHSSRSRESWMMLLPDTLPGNSKWPTIRSSLQAVSVAHYAVKTDEPGAMVRPQEMYTKALTLHRTFIRVNLSSQQLPPSTAFELVASNAILSFFEAVHCSHIDAYGFHISAAAAVLENIGPDLCQNGALNQLFFTIRSQMVWFALVWNFNYAKLSRLLYLS